MRFIYVHFPVLGAGSERAAEASECAGEQGRFWEYHDALYPLSVQAGRAAFTDDGLTAAAAGAGVDAERFSACLAGGGMAARVAGLQQFGIDSGVRSTPTVFVNGRRLVGMHDYGVYRAAIKEELARAR